MASKLDPEHFAFLNHPQAEAVLRRLYGATLAQARSLGLHFLPKLLKLSGKGIDWAKEENEAFFRDKYIPVMPEQGTFLHMQALALQAKTIVEFGTSYGISTIYLAAAARRTGGKVITTEYLPEKAAAARQNFAEAGLSDHIELREGDAQETLRDLADTPDLILLDGWPNLVYPVFRILEPKLRAGTVIIVDDTEAFRPSMQDYLDYIRNPANGYQSAPVKPRKTMEYSIKL